MDKTLFDTVLYIATDVRYWAEGRAEGDPKGNPRDLNGYCAIASAELFRQLTREGLKPEIHVWECPETADSHAFVVVDDHVVDVTATQFREFADKSVVIMHVRVAEQYMYWNSSYSFSSVEALIKRQKKDRWPARQIAYSA
jgi:hypothetical protein